jgi:predicted nucleotidyltransferase
MLKLNLTLFLVLSSYLLFGQITFDQVYQDPPVPQGNPAFDGVDLSSIAFADIDGDSDQDVLITGLNSSNAEVAKLYSNNGSGVFTEILGTTFDGVQNGSIAFADVDGDSDQDILITGLNSSSAVIAKLYRNDGTGAFTEVTGTTFDGVQNASTAFADVDGDSDPDVLITGLNSSSAIIAKLYRNDGTGIFTEVAGTIFDGVQNGSIAFADVDGISGQDVLITGANSVNTRIAKLYSNNGSGIFTEVVGTTFDGVQNGSIAFADVHGASGQDVLITGLNSSNLRIAKLYSNNGSGVFTEVAGTTFDGVQNASIAFADVDGDSDQDVLITGLNSSSTEIAKLYNNNGSGIFTEITGNTFDGVENASIAFADVDGDSKQDMLITGRNSSNTETAKLYSNSGSGVFTEVTGSPFEGVLYGSIALADVDGNASQDVLITGRNSANERIAKLYSNNGAGIFTEIGGTAFDGVVNGSIAFADVDGDSDQDVLITGRNSANGRIAKLYSNDGSGVFTEIGGTAFDGVVNGSIAFADIDGDLDQDLLITGRNSSDIRIAKLYSNNGSGVFTEITGTTFDAVNFGSIAFADVDGDSDQDALITGSNSANERIAKLYSNNGSGIFTEIPGTTFLGVQTSSIAFADVDGDSDQDVLITGSDRFSRQIARLYSNNGSGIFTEIMDNPLEGVDNSSIIFADVYGDSYKDVFITGRNKSDIPISKLYRNSTPYQPIISFSDIIKTFGDADFTLGATSNSVGTITYSIVGVANGTSLSGTNNENVTLGNAGTVKIRATQAASGLFASSTKDITLTITVKTITIAADAGQTKVYGDADPTFTYTVNTETLETGDAFTGLLSRAAGDDAANYVITLGTLSAGANYNIIFTSATFTITPRAITLTAEAGQTKVYGDAGPTLTYTATNGALVLGDAFTGLLSRATGEEVGNYSIALGTLSAGANYSITLIGADFSITTKAITVTADAGQTKIYGDADPIFTYSVTTGALVNGDSFTGALSRAAGEGIGTYSIGLGTLSAGANYATTFTAADFTITAKSITVTADAVSKIYGEIDPLLTYQISAGVVESELSITGSLTRVFGDDAGTYSIQLGTLAVGANYELNFVSADLTIDKATLVSTALSTSKEYGDVHPTLAISYVGFVNGDDASVIDTDPTTATTATTISEVGDYLITLTGGLDGNYNFSTIDGTLSIMQANLSANAVDESKTYGTANPIFSIIYSGFKGADDANVLDNPPIASTTATTNSDVENYPITLSEGTDNNYLITSIEGMLSIEKADQNISISAIPNQDITAATITVNATASSGLEVVLSVTGPASLNGNTLTLDGGEGTVIVIANQTGNANYIAAAEVSQSFEVINNNPCADFSVSLIESVNNKCFGEAFGSIDIAVSGGSENYIYSWSNGETTEDLSALTAGTYSLSVTDNNSCSATLEVTITEPEALTITSIITNEVEGSDGAVDLTITGGIGEYTFDWNNGARTEDLTNITGGEYFVTVTDGNNCVTSATIIVGGLVTAIQLAEIQSNISFYPNPSTDWLTIKSDFKEMINVRILDLQGKVVQPYFKIGFGENEIDISKIKKGLYLIEYTTKDIYYTDRLIKN